jgi:hypothetical protein
MRSSNERGMSLIEMTLAAALTMGVMAGVFAAAHPADGAFAAEPEVADVQQRLRVAADALTRDVGAAGAGAYIGEDRGPLMQYFAPVRPLRSGTEDDALMVIYVPSTAVQTTLSADFPATSDTIQVASGAGCAVGASLCGLKTGMTVLIYDVAGHWDAFSVTDVTGTYARLRDTSRAAGGARPPYAAGSKLVEARVRTFSRKTMAFPRTDQLVRDDTPVVDHIVGLTFTYFGDAAPPVLIDGRPSYGPQPPPLDVQTTGYPPGENCTFAVDAGAGRQVPRLPPLNDGSGLLELPPGLFDDGPWCPDEGDSARWDADVLRIRTIRVRVRVEAALDALRGPAGPLFVNGGNARMATWVPDLDLRWDVSPRNVTAVR